MSDPLYGIYPERNTPYGSAMATEDSDPELFPRAAKEWEHIGDLVDPATTDKRLAWINTVLATESQLTLDSLREAYLRMRDGYTAVPYMNPVNFEWRGLDIEHSFEDEWTGQDNWTTNFQLSSKLDAGVFYALFGRYPNTQRVQPKRLSKRKRQEQWLKEHPDAVVIKTRRKK